METATNVTMAVSPAATNHAAIFTLANLVMYLWGWLKVITPYIIGLGVYYYVLRRVLVDIRYIPSRSMHPTFEVGDLILVDKVSYYFTAPQVNDIVLFKPPEFLEQGPSAVVVKRMVAQAGDLVQVLQGRLVVNGLIQNEYYVAEARANDMRPIMVPEGHVFVMGDNRNQSYDSSHWGPLPIENIIGRTVTSFWIPGFGLGPRVRLPRRRSFRFLPSGAP